MKFFYSTASNSTIAHIALREAGVEFEGVEVSWNRNVNLEELRSVNKLGTVPAILLSNGKLLTQNIAILDFIAGRHPEQNLLPESGSFERSEALSWISFATSDLQRALFPVLAADRITTNETGRGDLKAYGKDQLKTYFEYLEKHLERSKFLLGENFSLADIPLFVGLTWTKWISFDLKPYPHLQSFVSAISKRPSVREVYEKEGLLDLLN